MERKGPRKPKKEKTAEQLALIEAVKADWKEYYENKRKEGKKTGLSAMHTKDVYLYAPQPGTYRWNKALERIANKEELRRKEE
jgi:hypothetical protein